MSNLSSLSISQAQEKLSAKEISSVELTTACLSVIESRNKALNAYLEVFEDARTQAAEADRRRLSGEDHPLLGIPLAIKDNILLRGRIASAGSRMLENYRAVYDSTVSKKLQKAGAVFLGRTNMDEFAMGGSTEHSAYAVTRNPHDETRVPGGSSGGSAAAVAADMALGALGSDTGGSIREPASFCGIVGLKPTYGAVSRNGLIAMGSSLDQIGPFARTVRDTEIIFNTIKGYDPLDGTSLPDTPLSKKTVTRIGVPRHLFTEGVDPQIMHMFEASLERLHNRGIEIRDIKLPTAEQALAMYYVIMFAEASTNLTRFDGVRYGLSLKGNSLFEDYAKTRAAGFGKEVRRRIMLGTYVLSSGYYDAYYAKATAARNVLRHEFSQALQEVDAIALPTAPSYAFKIGEKSDPLSMYLADIFTVPANLTGNPAISLPMGMVTVDGKQLPVGIQCVASHRGEDTLFSIGKQLLEETA